MKKLLLLSLIGFFYSCTPVNKPKEYLGAGITVPLRKISQDEVLGIYQLAPSSRTILNDNYLTINHRLCIFGSTNNYENRKFIFNNAPDWSFLIKNKDANHLGYMYGNWAIGDGAYIQENGDSLYNVTLFFPVQKFLNEDGTFISGFAILQKDNKIILADTYIGNNPKEFVIYEKVKEIDKDLNSQLNIKFDSLFKVDYPDKNLDSIKIWW